MRKFWERKEKLYIQNKIIQEGGAAVNAPDAGAVGVSGEDSASATTTADLVHELTATWEQQQLPAEEKVRLLTMLLNEAAPTPALMRNYDHVLTKMQSRLPLVELNSKRSYLQFKLRQAKSSGASDTIITKTETDLQIADAAFVEASRKYRAKYGEEYLPS